VANPKPAYKFDHPELVKLLALCVKSRAFARSEAKFIDLERVESKVDRYIISQAIAAGAEGEISTAVVETRCAVQPITSATPKLELVRARLHELEAVQISKALVPPIMSVIRRGATDSALRSVIADPTMSPEQAAAAFNKAAAVGVESSSDIVTTGFTDSRAWVKDLIDRCSTETLIKTGCLEIDEILHGGFERHTLWACAAGPGEGKSFFLSSLTAEYLHRGQNVIVFSLELESANWCLRVMENLAGESRIKPQSLEDMVVSYLDRNAFVGTLQVVKLQSNLATVDDMRRHIQNLYDDGHPRFDLCCIDYLDLVAPPKIAKGREMKAHEEAKFTYEEARRLCLPEEHDLVTNVWTATQIRDRDTKRNKTGDVKKQDVSDSSWKMRTVDGGISILCSEQDRGDKQRRYGILKRRNADDSIAESPPVPHQLSYGRLWAVQGR
jgi:hypothetical protein